MAPGAETDDRRADLPSDLGGAKVLPGDAGLDEDTALAWGPVCTCCWNICRIGPATWACARRGLA